jgi:hypothetical protein
VRREVREVLRPPLGAELRGSKLGNKLNIINEIFSTLNKF